MKPSYQQIPHTFAQHKDGTGGPKQKLHPFSLILLILWGAFIVGLLCLLEVAVIHGPGSAQGNDSFHPSWALITLPTILLTVFTQAHVPITAFHLARIAVSALQNPNTTPNSWAELFWMADQEWTGPVGIIKTTYLSIHSRTRASFTYILFATTCAIALVTPVLLSQAYQLRQVLITRSHEIQLRAVSTFGNSTSSQNSAMQQTVALGSWETGLSVFDIYNTSLFIPKRGGPWSTTFPSQNVFYASDVGNATATLPGVVLSGNCTPFNDDPYSKLNPIAQSNNLTTQLNLFNEYCRSHNYENVLKISVQEWYYFMTNFTLAMCDRQNADGDSSIMLGGGSSLQSEGIVLYHYTQPIPIPHQPVEASSNAKTVHGIIQCNSTQTIGNASISGLDHTYTDFISTDKSSEFIIHANPFAIFIDSLFSFVADPDSKYDNDSSAQLPLLRVLGFHQQDFNNTFPYPSILNISESLWSGIEHKAASTVNLWKEPNQVFNATVPRNVALYTRNTPYIVAAYVMLSLWLAMLAGATAWSYRRTFSPSLNSYVAAKLIDRERSLLEDVPIGEARDNERLRAPFKPLGLCSEKELEQELKHSSTT
ncbi:hypothetical protein V5O48_005003 [Marasmius crinis-equi]|uniref:Uncharacterized protein n=1 Tax=Marasmius crinis-equi TaxID=585013 RepID=A0ABR3FPA0_9AGAR